MYIFSVSNQGELQMKLSFVCRDCEKHGYCKSELLLWFFFSFCSSITGV
uniref:Uncharacterized protein n=1 Tax=Rhizophora mucronata TaxID=61149 RepID=A0A2P2N1T4_RHIMU